MQLSLATYNIHRCVGQDGRYDPDRILHVLKELKANVVALQEVDSREHHGLELLHCLANELGYTPIAGPTLLRGDGHYGNGILTNLPVLRVARLDLSVPGKEPRGALDVDLDWHGVTLHVVGTHLGLWPADRRTQVQRLLKGFHSEAWEPGILMGDINEWLLWGRPIRKLHGLFGKTPALPTFPARLPVLPLDRIWVHPHRMLASLKVHKTRMARVASDHLPLKASIRLTKAQPIEERVEAIAITAMGTSCARGAVSSPGAARFLERG